MTTSPQPVSSRPTPAAPNTIVPGTATPSTPAVQVTKRRRGRAPAAPSNTFAFYDGAVSADGTITSIGKRFETEIDAQKASVRSGKPYLKIETLRVEFVVTDGKLVAVATPAGK